MIEFGDHFPVITNMSYYEDLIILIMTWSALRISGISIPSMISENFS